MTNCDPTPSAMVKLQATILAVSRMNFYLWMYLAQEGYFEEALEFVQEKLRIPSPFETMLGVNPLDVAAGCNSTFDDF
jgi:hypothetical protein